MLVCVTGAAGRIGSVLASRLQAEGHSVRCVVRPGGTRVAALPGCEVVEAALTDTSALTSAVRGAEIVVHLAAQMVPGRTPIDDYFDINVLGTLRLLEASVAQSRPVRQFVFASTDNTYGPSDPAVHHLTEDGQQLPGDYYGTAKLLCEDLVRNYHKIHGIDFTILRYGSVVAPGEAVSLFRMSWVRAFLDGQVEAGRRSNLWPLFRTGGDFLGPLGDRSGASDSAAVLVGPGGEPWSIHLTDVRDVVDGTVRCLGNEHAFNEHFNIGGPRTTTFEEGAEVISRHTGLPTVTLTMPETLAFELSTGKAQKVVGYQPEHDFASMVRTGLREATA